MGGGDGFGVELDAPEGVLSVAESHDLALGGVGDDLEGGGDGGGVHDEGVVAGGGEGVGKS